LLPQMKVHAQDVKSKKEVQQYEEQLLMQLNANNYDFYNENNAVNLPENIERSADFINQKRSEFGIAENENHIQLYINGNNNNSTAEQNGKGNIMDLGIDGNNNSGDYLQQGHENYIFDRIKGNDLSHQIEQFGNGLGIYNEGMQELPLIINQKGQGMKMKITGQP
ncbi:MAG: hypothetical protein ACLFPH_11030, partial [Bacteroidales bacterium]